MALRLRSNVSRTGAQIGGCVPEISIHRRFCKLFRKSSLWHNDSFLSLKGVDSATHCWSLMNLCQRRFKQIAAQSRGPTRPDSKKVREEVVIGIPAS